MNYSEWADEYRLQALRIKQVMDKKKGMLHDRLTADARKRLVDDIAAYRTIYYELNAICETLRDRAQRYPNEA